MFTTRQEKVSVRSGLVFINHRSLNDDWKFYAAVARMIGLMLDLALLLVGTQVFNKSWWPIICCFFILLVILFTMVPWWKIKVKYQAQRDWNGLRASMKIALTDD